MLKKFVLYLCLVLFVGSTYGCLALLAGAAGGAGTAKWLSGKLVQEVEAPFEKTIKAAKSGLKFFNFEITKEVKKAEVAQIKSIYTDGKTIWIDVHRLSSSLSRIEVRVGVLGNEEAARKILKRILQYL